jgi:chorismate synthase
VAARPATIGEIIDNVPKNPVRCADLTAAAAMSEAIGKARSEGDSIGGVVEIMAVGLPAGLGSPVFSKLDADIAGALMGIGGVKAVEIGAGTRATRLKGSEMNDEFVVEEGQVRTRTNNAGGILGGISTGMPVVCRISVKPTPSIAKKQHTVDMARMKEEEISIKGRHDPSIVPRVGPVAEAMVALVIADQMILSGKICPDRV